MIIDTLANAKLYENAHPLFKKVFDFLTTQPLATMEAGRYEIDGDKAYAMIQEPENKPANQCQLECHRKYIDLQLVVSGNEMMGWAPIVGLGHALPFNEKDDYGLFKDAPLSWFDVRPGCFAIFYPGDAHAPNCGTGTHRKVVVKILADLA